ncbi:hypothetical protein, partial [Xanthomonas phaseoli]|uniref:hypothetical protein n=1 Tax=Xanthomonas phaseoli TaxID=1985254 RepID=UPI001ED9556A
HAVRHWQRPERPAPAPAPLGPGVRWHSFIALLASFRLTTQNRSFLLLVLIFLQFYMTLKRIFLTHPIT